MRSVVCGRDATIRVFAWGRAPEDDEDDILSGETYCDECKGAPLAEAGRRGLDIVNLKG
jgi:hypothetical protein